MIFKKKKKSLQEHWINKAILKGHTGWIYAILFNKRYNFFASASSDSTVRLWDSQNFNNLSILKGHVGGIGSIIFFEKYNSLISGGDDFTIRYWDIEYSKNIRKYNGHLNSVVKITNHPHLNIFASGSKDNTIRLWDIRLKREISILFGHLDTVTSLTFNKETPHIISGSLDNTVRFWDLCSKQKLVLIKNIGKKILEIHDIKNKEYFSYLTLNSINLCRNDGIFITKIKFTKNYNNCFSINRYNQSVIGMSNGWIKYLNFENKKNLSFLKENENYSIQKTNENILSISFNATGNQILSGGLQNTINVFTQKWKMLH